MKNIKHVTAVFNSPPNVAFLIFILFFFGIYIVHFPDKMYLMGYMEYRNKNAR